MKWIKLGILSIASRRRIACPRPNSNCNAVSGLIMFGVVEDLDVPITIHLQALKASFRIAWSTSFDC